MVLSVNSCWIGGFHMKSARFHKFHMTQALHALYESENFLQLSDLKGFRHEIQ